MKGFREFILRGNVMDLAVAVVVGAAFTAVVTALVVNIINPVIGLIFNAKSLDTAMIWHVAIPTGTADIKFGAFLGAVINFVIIAAVVYFVFIVPVNKLMERAFPKEPETPAVEPSVSETQLLTEIRDLLANGGSNTAGQHSA